VIFVGGEEDTYQWCQPMLAVLGTKTLYVGPSGAGATMKLCANTSWDWESRRSRKPSRSA